MTTIYQAGNGQWILYNNGIKTYFATQGEATNMSEKLKYAKDVQAVSTKLIQAIEALPRISSVWADRLYGPGEANQMTDEDVESLGITAAELGAFITPLAAELTNFANNLAVATGDYSVTLNKLRTDV